jgi:hypothetical protein
MVWPYSCGGLLFGVPEVMNHPLLRRGTALLADERHGPAAPRAQHDGRLRRLLRGWLGCSGFCELSAYEGEALTSPGMQETVVAQSMEPMWQDVLEVTVDKLGSVDSNRFGCPAGPVPDGDGDAFTVCGEDTRIADGTFVQVGAEIFDGVGAVAKIGHVAVELDSPELVDLSLAKHLLFGQCAQQESLQSRGEDIASGQPAAAGRVPESAVAPQTHRRNDEVDMWMQCELLSPCLEHAKEAASTIQLPGLLQDILDRPGCAGEEDLIEPRRVRQTKPAQLPRQGEGDHIVVDVQAILESGRNPGSRLGPAASGAKPMIAAVPGEMILLAMSATIAPPAHCLGAAKEDRLQGLALIGVDGTAVTAQTRLMKACQHRGDTRTRESPRRLAARSQSTGA